MRKYYFSLENVGQYPHQVFAVVDTGWRWSHKFYQQKPTNKFLKIGHNWLILLKLLRSFHTQVLGKNFFFRSWTMRRERDNQYSYLIGIRPFLEVFRSYNKIIFYLGGFSCSAKIFLIDLVLIDDLHLHVDKTRTNVSQPFPRLTFFSKPTNLLYLVMTSYDGCLRRSVIR